MLYILAAFLFFLSVFAVAAVVAGAKAEKRTNRIFEDEKAKRN